MGQMNDIPYSVLKENDREYEVMLLRDLYDNTYTDIAKEYMVSTATVITVYHRTKIRQLRLYARHLAIVHGHEDTKAFSINEVHDCYWDFRYVAAYFEKEYGNILTAYRAGEPGMPEQLIATLPPPQKTLSTEAVDRLIYLRENKRKTFLVIGKELLLTEARARREYELYYHRKVLALCDAVKEKTGDDVSRYYLDLRCGTKKQYEMLLRNYPGLLDNE